MIKFNKVTVKNFKSFGNKEIEFKVNEHGSVLIIGDNKDIGDEGTSANGTGKCLGKDTPVMMYDGTIKMVQDIVVGDQLMGPDGSPRNVLSLARGREELFKVHQNIGMDYVVNRSHILSLKVGTTRPKYGHVRGEIINIPVETYLSYPSYVKSGVCGYIGDLTKWGDGDPSFDPWLLGLWLSDGTASKPQFTVNINDTEIIEEVRRITSSYGYTEHISPSDNRKNCISPSYSGGMLIKLRDMGVLNNKHIPEEFMQASYENRLHLLAGILDGDGYKEKNKHAIDIVLKDNQLAQDFLFLARSVGLRVSVRDKFSKCPGFDGAYYKRFTVTGDIERIPNRLSRKKATPRSPTAKPRNFGVTGISLTSIGEGDYYGFEIDGDRLFCLGDMTVTHNTSILEAICFALYGKGLDKQKADEMVNFKNGKKMLVTLEMEVGGAPFTIKRGRKPNVLELYAGDKSLTRDSMKNTEQEIEDIVGLSYDIFLSIVFLSPFKKSFMGLGTAEQRSFMESLLSLDTLATRAEATKAIKKELGVDIKLAKKDLDNAILRKEDTERRIQGLKEKSSRFETDRDKELEDLNEVLVHFDSTDFDGGILLAEEISSLEESLANINYVDLSPFYRAINETKTLIEEHDSINQRIDKWEEDHNKKKREIEDKIAALPSLEDINLREEVDNDVMHLNNLMLQINDSIGDMKRQIDQLTKNQEKLEKEFSDLDSGKCPYCKQRHTDEDRIGEIEIEFVSLEEQKEKLETTIKEQEERYKTTEKELQGAKDRRPDISNSVTAYDVQKLSDELTRLSQEASNPYVPILNEWYDKWESLDAVEQTLEKHQTDLQRQEDKNEEIEAHINELKEEIKKKQKECLNIVDTCDPFAIRGLAKERESIVKSIQELKDKQNPYIDQIAEEDQNIDISEYEKTVNDLEKKEKHAGYLVKLLTDPKSFIRQNIVDQYLPFVNKKIVEYTDFLGLPHVVEINNDMSVNVDYLGKDVSYYTLSRGERMRLDVATAMAFRELLKLLGKNTNILMIDELFDSAMDRCGSRKMFEFVGNFADNLLLVSHREDFDTLVDAKLTVVKQNAFSFLRLDT